MTRDDTSDAFVGYVNGVQRIAFTDAGALATFTGVNNIIHFLRDDNAVPGEHSGGFLDRVRLYDGVLTAAEVTDLFNGGPPPGLPPERGLPPSTLVAAILPSSRSVRVGTAATAFATMINTSQGTASGCRVAPPANLPAAFTFQTTNPTTNQVIGSPDTPIDIPTGAAQSFVLALTPSSALAPTEVALSFTCTNSTPAASIPGLNTLLLSAATTPIPDIVALAAVATNNGIVALPSTTGTGVFAVASVNVGASGTLRASAVRGVPACRSAWRCVRPTPPRALAWRRPPVV